MYGKYNNPFKNSKILFVHVHTIRAISPGRNTLESMKKVFHAINNKINNEGKNMN